MLKNTTLNLPEELIFKARAYAAAQNTSLTAIIRAHLEAITAASPPEQRPDILSDFCSGRISKEAACTALGLRDYADLLIALGEEGLPLPTLPSHQLDSQATIFADIWRQA